MRFLIILQLIAALCASDAWSATVKKDNSPVNTDGAKTDVPPAQTKYKFDQWEAWNAFKEGSMVEYELESSGTKMRERQTIDRKTDDEITLKIELILNGDKDSITSVTQSVKKTANIIIKGNCPLCGKPFKDHKDESYWSEEIVKVGDKNLNCQVYESAAKNCRGDDNPKIKAWYNTDVPGHLVKLESLQSKITLIKFDAL